jgi:DNA-directed RNA polymerase specialized sigma24 family protein
MMGDLDRSAMALIEAAQAGDRAAFDRALVVVRPHAADAIHRWLRTTRLPEDKSHDDVIQEAILRFWSSPPTRPPAKSATQSMLAWLKTTSVRIALDWRRQARLPGEPKPAADGGKAAEKDKLRAREIKIPIDANRYAGRERPDDDHAARALEDAFRRILESDYAVGLRLYSLMLEEPFLTSQEYAARLDTTSQNIDQMRSRLREALVARMPELRYLKRRR